MSFSNLVDNLDNTIRDALCDPVELRPAAGGAAVVVPAMIDQSLVEAPGGFGAPMLQATIQLHTRDGLLKVGDVAVTGRFIDGLFVPGERGWRIAGAPTRDPDGAWQTAAVERIRL